MIVVQSFYSVYVKFLLLPPPHPPPPPPLIVYCTYDTCIILYCVYYFVWGDCTYDITFYCVYYLFSLSMIFCCHILPTCTNLSVIVILFFSKCFRDGFLPNKKINYQAQHVVIWRCNVECHDLTFCVQRVMLRVTHRRKRAFVWKSKQNQCDNELLNAHQLAMTRMDRNHTDKY